MQWIAFIWTKRTKKPSKIYDHRVLVREYINPSNGWDGVRSTFIVSYYIYMYPLRIPHVCLRALHTMHTCAHVCMLSMFVNVGSCERESNTLVNSATPTKEIIERKNQIDNSHSHMQRRPVLNRRNCARITLGERERGRKRMREGDRGNL